MTAFQITRSEGNKFVVKKGENTAQAAASAASAEASAALTTSAFTALTKNGLYPVSDLSFTARLDNIALTTSQDDLRNGDFETFSGGAQSFTTPGTITANAVYLPRLARNSATTKKWARIDFVVRSDATDPGNTSATIHAYGRVFVDPESDEIGPLRVRLKDDYEGTPVTLTQADLAAKYIIAWKPFQADGTPATNGYTVGTITGATPEKSYALGLNAALTGTYPLYAGGAPVFPVALTNVSDPVETFRFAPSSTLRSAIGAPEVVLSARRKELVQVRSRVNTIRYGVSARCGIGLGLTSWFSRPSYGAQMFARRAVAEFGDGGVGVLAFANAQGVPDARGLYFHDSSPTGWTRVAATTETSPNMQSLTASGTAKIKLMSLSNSPHSAISAAKLHYTGNGAAEIRWRWYDANVAGAWTNATLSATAGNQFTLDLTGFPSGYRTNASARNTGVEIEWVSGTPKLNLLDMQSTTDGVYFHQLGWSGSQAEDWLTAAANPQWQAGIAALGINGMHLHGGTNDEAARTQPTDYARDMLLLADAYRSVSAGMDVSLACPPENNVERVWTIPRYWEALYNAAAVHPARYPVLNVQAWFGDGSDPDSYNNASARPLLSADGDHPSETSQPRGNMMLAESLWHQWFD